MIPAGPNCVAIQLAYFNRLICRLRCRYGSRRWCRLRRLFGFDFCLGLIIVVIVEIIGDGYSAHNSTSLSLKAAAPDLKAGRKAAADELWTLYFDRLVQVARRRLTGVPKRVADEEDVAISVFKSLCAGAARGQFAEHVRRDDLWRLLLHLTRQKAAAHVREQTRQKRGGGKVRGESAFLNPNTGSAAGDIANFVSDEPTPSYLAMMNEEHARLLELLPDDTLRDVAIRRMQGDSNAEIAAALTLSVRSVERKLKLIRGSWERELPDCGSTKRRNESK